MLKRGKFDKLTYVQLQQKVIHLDSELSFIRTDREKKDRKYLERINMLKQDNERLKVEFQEVLNDHVMYSRERDELIKDYNELLLKNKAAQDKIVQLEKHIGQTEFDETIERFSCENDKLVNLVEELKKEIEFYQENTERHVQEKQISEAEMIRMRKELSRLEEDNEEMHRIIIKERELVQEHQMQIVALKNEVEEKNHFYLEKKVMQESVAELQKQLIEKEAKAEMLNEEKELSIADFSKERDQLNNNIQKIRNEKQQLEQALEKKNIVLDDVTMQNQKMSQELQVLQEKEEQLQQKNVSYLQKITQLEADKNMAFESESHLKKEIINVKSQLMEMEKLKTEMLDRLKERENEVGKLKDENHRFVEEKTVLLNKLAKLEEENASFHESISILSVQRQSDEKRMDKITSNLNEVFTETKQLVRMTSSLKHQLEAKTLELNQIKKEKEMLMQEVIQLKEDYEKSESRKNELEDQIETMRSELMKAQNSLSRLEQFETEKLRLKEDLESKIDEFNMLTDHYQREKESYLHVLEHVQDQVNVYKEKSEQFDSEKGSWSKQIDELKSELIQTKATIVKMEELEQKNVNLAAEIQAKEIEIYKTKKESERAIQHQMEQFKAEMKLYQDKISQYEKDREIWEKQMKQMKAQFAGLESSLEEKENFIKQYINQPLASMPTTVRPAQQIVTQSEQPSAIQHNPSPQQTPPLTQQPTDWFQRMASQQQGIYQAAQKNQNSNSNSTTMDFFTLRSKTTQPSVPSGPPYGSQWNQD